jgi:hypothetical protein
VTRRGVVPGRTLLLLLSLLLSVLRRLMVSNDTAGAGSQKAVMAGNIASDSPDSSPL